MDEAFVEEWLRAPLPAAHGTATPSPMDHSPSTPAPTATNGNGSGTGGFQQGSGTSAASAASGSGSEVEDDAAPQPTYSLFAFPGEDNFAGVKYPLSWAADIRRRSTASHK